MGGWHLSVKHFSFSSSYFLPFPLSHRHVNILTVLKLDPYLWDFTKSLTLLGIFMPCINQDGHFLIALKELTWLFYSTISSSLNCSCIVCFLVPKLSLISNFTHLLIHLRLYSTNVMSINVRLRICMGLYVWCWKIQK